MSLLIQDDRDNILGKKYNVEYKLGNDSIHTFSNVLTNVDSTYFWFSSLENGLDIIRQDRIVTMTCLERNYVKSISNNRYAFNRHLYCRECGNLTDSDHGNIIGNEGIFICYDCQECD